MTILLILLLASHLAAAEQRPILFVHGNGDSAANWYTTIWRFESNGYKASLLFAMDFTHPMARNDDTKHQENRSGTVDQAKELAAKVDEIKSQTGFQKVALVASSRGGYAVRNYIKNFRGASSVSHAILCGTPNHGIQANAAGLNNEFNGIGPFLSALNAGDEVQPGVQFMTIRSDSQDKYAQPDGRYVGMPGRPTYVTYASPELRGAKNIVLPGLDHRETAFHPLAFKAMFQFITGEEPRTLDVTTQSRPVLNGMVSGFLNGAPTNLPLPNAVVEVHELDAANGKRLDGPVHRRVTGKDGLWGPFSAKSEAFYEFVVAAEGYPITHIYRTPFLRSSAYVHIRLQPLAEKDKGTGSLVSLVRPRGYLGHGRDTFLIDDKVPPGVSEGIPANAEAKQKFTAGSLRSVKVTLNKDTLLVTTYPLEAGHVVIAEFP